jgi:hypothetical protein
MVQSLKTSGNVMVKASSQQLGSVSIAIEVAPATPHPVA